MPDLFIRSVKKLRKFQPTVFRSTQVKHSGLDRYIYEKHGILPGEINFFAFLAMFLILVFSVIPLLLYFTIMALALVFLSSIITYWGIRGYLYRKTTREKAVHDMYANFVYQDFLALWDIFQTEGDVLRFLIVNIANSSYPFSHSFEKIQYRVELGATIESELESFQSPSNFLKQVLKKCVSESSRANGKPVQSNFFKMEHKFKQFSKSLESRINLLFFMTIFLPIGVIFNLILNTLPSVVLVFLPPVYFILAKLLDRVLFQQSVLFFSSASRKNEDQEDWGQLKHLNWFLERLAVLTPHLPPERAIALLLEELGQRLPETREKILPISNSICFYQTNLQILFSKLENLFSNQRYQVVFRSLLATCTKNSAELGSKIEQILKYLYMQHELELERKDILKGEQLRAQLFGILLPLILGILGGLIPVFSMIRAGFSVSGELSGGSGLFATITLNPFFYFTQFLLILAISVYFISRTVETKKNRFFFLLSLGIYSVTFWIVVLVI